MSSLSSGGLRETFQRDFHYTRVEKDFCLEENIIDRLITRKLESDQ